MLVRIALAALLLPLAACSPDEAQVVTDALEGTRWVEATARQDTLSFELLGGGAEVMQLARGCERRVGPDLPYQCVPPYSHESTYSYEVTAEGIDLWGYLSSGARISSYPFAVEGKTLTIGNFYQSDLGEVLAFERLD